MGRVEIPEDLAYEIPCDGCRREMKLIAGRRYACECGHSVAPEDAKKRLGAEMQRLIELERE